MTDEEKRAVALPKDSISRTMEQPFKNREMSLPDSLTISTRSDTPD